MKTPLPEQSGNEITFKDPAMILFKDRTLKQVNSLLTLDDVLFGHTTDTDAIEMIESARFYAKMLMMGEEEHLLISKYKFGDEVHQARSPQSTAKYLLWNESKIHKHGFLMQYLPPHAETSYHYHNKQMEIFRVLYGTCWIQTNEVTLPLLAGASLLIPPKTAHQLLTYAEIAFNVIEIYNVNYDDHIEEVKKTG
jgi:mannose-6-phosphate isomerase-like protein (cupin superfamily)